MRLKDLQKKLKVMKWESMIEEEKRLEHGFINIQGMDIHEN
jgi:hypothetical protein